MPEYVYRHKHSPYWQFDFVLEGRRFSGSTKAEKKQVAKRFVEKLRNDILSGNHGRKKLTYGQASQAYWVQHGQHQKAAKWIEAGLERTCEGLGSRRLLRDIGIHDIGEYLGRRRLSVGPATTNRDLVIIRAVWRFAEKRLRADIGEMPDWTVERQPS